MQQLLGVIVDVAGCVLILMLVIKAGRHETRLEKLEGKNGKLEQ